MATNPPKGDGHRNGMVRERSQTYNPKTDTWTKRDVNTGRFMDGKKDGTPFKGVRKEKWKEGKVCWWTSLWVALTFEYDKLIVVLGKDKNIETNIKKVVVEDFICR